MDARQAINRFNHQYPHREVVRCQSCPVKLCTLGESHRRGIDATLQKLLPSSRAILIEMDHLLLEEVDDPLPCVILVESQLSVVPCRRTFKIPQHVLACAATRRGPPRIPWRHGNKRADDGKELPRQHEHLKTQIRLSVKVESCGILWN